MPKGKVPFDIKKLLSDKESYPDDLVVTLANGAELSMADIRAYDEASGGELKAEMTKVAKEWTKIKAEQEKITKASEEVAKLYLDVQEKQKQLQGVRRQPEVDPFDELAENDPLAKHVKGLRDSYEAKFGALTQKLDQLLKNQSDMGKVYMNDTVRSEFNGLRSDPDFSNDITLEGVFDYAVKQGVKRSDGIPDMKRAYEQLVSPKRTERLINEAKEAGRKEAEEARKKEAFMPPPNAFGNSRAISPSVLRGPGGVNLDSNKPPRNLREAIARATQDPTMFGFTSEEGNA